MKVESKTQYQGFKPYQLIINVEDVDESNILYEIFGYQHSMANNIGDRIGIEKGKVFNVMSAIRKGITESRK